MNHHFNALNNHQNYFCGMSNLARPPNYGFYGGPSQNQMRNPNEQFFNHNQHRLLPAQAQKTPSQNFGQLPSSQNFGQLPSSQNFGQLQSSQNYGYHNNNAGSMAMRPVNNIWTSQPSPQMNSVQTQQHNKNNPHTQRRFQKPYFINRNQQNNREFQGHQNNREFQGHQNNREFQGHQNNNSKSNKVKVDKRDLAENNVFFCDVCDRGFKTDQIYKEHVDNHIKCRVDDCTYVAAPKLVNLHYNMQHRNGYAKKIWSLESTEDVEEWIKERKRHFPTAENIAKKKLLREEKIARGEVLETRQFGKMRGRGKFRNRHDNNSKMKRKNAESEETQGIKKMKTNSNFQSEEKSGSTDNFTALQDPLSYSHPHVENNHTSQNSSNTEVTNSVGLTSIVSCYGDDSDSGAELEAKEDNESSKVMNTQPVSTNYSIHDGTCEDNNNNEHCDNDNNMESGDDRKVYDNNRKYNRKKQFKQKQKERQMQNLKKKPTLLEMLLANEIRHERNVILQCVHHIVKKSFFDTQHGDSINNNCNSITDK